MTKILINSYDKNSGNFQNFAVQLNTPLVVTQPTRLKLEYFKMTNGIYNITGEYLFYVLEQNQDTTSNTVNTKQFNVIVPSGSYTAADFASASQTALINASSADGYGWDYTVTYNSTTTQLTFNMTTTAPTDYIYTASINSLNAYSKFITGLPIYSPYSELNFLPSTTLPHLSNYNLLVTINSNTHDHISTNGKKYSFIVPFNTSENNIEYTPNNNFENVITVYPQSFNNITVNLTCMEFDPIINNDCVMLLELL